MELIKVIEELQKIYRNYGNCKVLKFNVNTLSSDPIASINYITKDQFREDLKDDQYYIENFNKELNNVIII